MDKNKINIKSIQNNVKKGKIIWIEHCLNRLNQRDILIEDVISTINTGKIIEYYYDDYPYQSCLILGKDCNNEVLHIVCGLNGNTVYVITAYYPDSIKWEEDMKTRRMK